ncbi:MAG: filamentous hemagglutinin N-terminal domain-containing protein [Brasilonema angustatum HA4187-MV1]|jgi:filamentous hemagglutinin family protein|nr:filamentous hemagglutinin N-terminal domain-containing protein [Brasilonema angustatum HA4187-MV1]
MGSLAPITIAVAQVSADGTVSTTVTTPDGKNFNINDGTRRGGNLFHSFKEFSVPTGGSAVFQNPTDVQNIIGRVTGGSVSNIDGVIRALGKANLFLLNPAGIIFGPNASLNIGGSFLGSTAHSFLFDNGFEFSATDPQAPPLLTINVPIGLRYRDNPQNITSQSAVLNVPQGNSFALVGGNVSLNGGAITAAGARVEIAGLSAPGIVGLSSNGSLSFPVGVQFGDISLINGATVDVRARGAGSVVLNARNIDLLGGNISAGVGKGLTADNSPRGDITLNAIGKVTINYPSRVTNIVDEGATGNAGNINIKAGDISITNKASTPTTSALPAALDTGPGGQGQKQGQGRSGNISLEATGSISLTGQDQKGDDRVISTYNGVGQSGDISLKADNSISLDNAFLIASSFRGNGGSISLQGNESVSTKNNSSLVSQAFGQGNSGSIVIESSLGSVSLQDTLVNTAVGSAGGRTTNPALGDAGDIKIRGQSVFITAGTEVSSRSFNGGKSGRILVNGTNQVEISGSDPQISKSDRSGDFKNSIVTTTSKRLAGGNAGDITINSRNLRISDKGAVTATTEGKFRGGNININASTVDLTNDGQVSVSSLGTGGAGLLTVTANSIKLDNRASINANTTAGQGNIILNSDDVILRRNSNITTNATATADGGNITINTDNLVALENSKITANAQQGYGGKVNITTKGNRFLSPDSVISATSERGPQFSGTVQFNTPEIDPSQGLFELTETVIDPAQQIAQNPCTKGFGSSFTITGRGGLPTDPNKILSSDNVHVDLIQPIASTVGSTTATYTQPSTSPPVKRIIPAQGWIYNEKGQVVLVAYDPTKTGPQRQPQTPANSCAADR